MTSLFNIACCHSQLGDTRSGLVALAGARVRVHCVWRPRTCSGQLWLYTFIITTIIHA